MTKKIRILLFFLATLAVGASFVAYFLTKSPDRNYCKLAQKELEIVLEEIESVRGLSPQTSVEIEVVTRSWIEKNWALPFANSQREEIFYEETIYKALFLLPQNANLTQIKIDQFKATMAAAVGDKIFITREFFDPYDEVKALEILSHETTHIIQRHHFSIPERATHDGRQARSALIEGDALITAENFVLYHFGIKLQDSSNASYSPIEEIWLFPYKYGKSFVKNLLEVGGWKKVNFALENPPNTTEQILHPEKYFTCEGFVVPSAPSLEEGGWKRVKSDRLGEHVILTVLSTSLPENEAGEAAEGWNGDNLTLYIKDDGFLVEWIILWDTKLDALQFEEAFLKVLEKRGERITPELWRCNDRYVLLYVKEEKTAVVISNDFEAINNSLVFIRTNS